MTHADLVARTGAFLGALTFVHFLVDWVFQTHAEAMAKHANWRVRARHCAIYTAPFAPLLAWIGMGPWELFACMQILFWSHFVEDTYLPVFLWAKYVRRPPSMQWRAYKCDGAFMISGPPEFVGRFPVRNEVAAGHTMTSLNSPREKLLLSSGPDALESRIQKELDRIGFLEFVETPLGKILMIAVDQIVHVGFLVPVAVLAAQI